MDVTDDFVTVYEQFIHMIYLDNHATTRCDPRVVEEMLPYFSEIYGNPHSTHEPGRLAGEAVARARERIARSIRAEGDEIVFTSGGTESNHLALLGVALHPRVRRRQLVSVSTEHPSVMEPLRRLGESGFSVEWLPVIPQGTTSAGRIDLDRLARLVTEKTALVSVMLANNEIGVIQPIAEIAEICHREGALLHCDGVQGVGKISVDVNQLQVDLLSFSAHKFYGPKGIGGLYVRKRDRRVRLLPQLEGGGQQEGLRGGTLSPAAVVGMARAMELGEENQVQESNRLEELRNRLWLGLQQGVEGIQLNGPVLDTQYRLVHNLNVCFPHVEGEAIMLKVSEMAMSSGSACSSKADRPSHVLLALGLSETGARCSLRFGLGRFTTKGEIDQAIERITSAFHQLIAGRDLSL